MSLSNLWQPKFIIAALQDFTWVEVSHPPRNWAKNIHVLLSQADDPVERGFVLHIDWKCAVNIIPPSVFLFPLVSGNKHSDVSQDTYVHWLTLCFSVPFSLRSVFLPKCSLLVCSEMPGMPVLHSWPSKKSISHSSSFLLVSVSSKAIVSQAILRGTQH